MRQIVLDTETTGLEPELGHRIIEIGAVEVINRRLTGRHFHHYINPERDIDDGALEVHGITRAFLRDKPLFADICDEFIDFIKGAELVIHNAEFDVGFIDSEFRRLPGKPLTENICRIKDSLALARSKHPGQKNNLDALCRRYAVDNTHRELHGALLDAEILADVYLLMTGGQTHLFGGTQGANNSENSVASPPQRLHADGLHIVRATEEEAAAHEAYLDMLKTKSGTQAIWRKTSTQ
ncbi:MAG: DNA polymerase III subunit epsilon [bacterium]